MFSLILKDYIDHLHDLSLVDHGGFDFATIKTFTVYFFKTISLSCWYVISFEWLKDFIELPAVFKQNYLAVMNGQMVFRKGVSLSEQASNGGFAFLDVSPLNTHNMFSGFINSFFLCLPLSIPHILSLRALLVNGVPAGICASLGLLLGQLLFSFCILFGLEFMIQPFIYLEPAVILLGCKLVFDILIKCLEKPDYKVYDLKKKNILKEFFFTNFCLAWFEQVCISNYFGSFTVTTASNLFETTNGSHFFLMTLTYIFGLLLGSLIWLSFFGWGFLALKDWLSWNVFTDKSVMEINRRTHWSMILGLFALAMTSFPYYGYDYFAANGTGYLPNDQAMEEIIPKQAVKESIYTMDIDEGELVFDDQLDIADDITPFQTPDWCPQLGFEYIALAPDMSWLNRFHFRSRTEEQELVKLTGPIVRKRYRRDPTVAIYEEIPYETPDVDYDDMFYMSGSFVLDTFEEITDAAFRSDVFEELVDTKSKSYYSEAQVFKLFREKYYTNPVYKGLMRLNNMSFLSGQPQRSNMSAQDEQDIFRRRAIAEKYLNSMVKYRRAIREEGVSWPHEVYNQQFKGSLEVVRKYNAVRLSEYLTDYKSNSALYISDEMNKKVLKYDQPLYKKYIDEQNALLHEELPLWERHKQPNRFLQLSHSRPLYIGWDGALRKFMVRSARVSNMIEEPFNITVDPNAVQKDPVEKVKKKKKRQKQKQKQINMNQQTDESQSVDTPKKRPLKKPKPAVPSEQKGLPDYYNFQAWSPGVEDATVGTKFKLPNLLATQDDIAKVQEALELVIDQEEEDDPLPGRTRGERWAAIVKRNAMREVFKSSPIYNWFWGEAEALETEWIPYFRIGDAAPPKLDGVGWPGKNERCTWNVSEQMDEIEEDEPDY